MITKTIVKEINRSLIKLSKFGFGLTALIFLIPNFSFALSLQAQCPDVVERGHLNVLTINLLFSEIDNRMTRLDRIANFIKQQGQGGEPVDVILLQEVIGGPLSETINSSLDLKRLLAERGEKYNLRHRLANGLPGILTVGNAILSRCEIIHTVSKILPFVSEEPFNGFKIPLRRKVIMSRINVQDFGEINVYNTHLCAFCDTIKGRLEQTRALLKFVKNIENLIQGENLIILGGDFNINLNIPDDIAVYELIIEDFRDTYATINSCFNCCSEDEGEAGCTFAVQGNPFTVKPFMQGAEEPKRIDYIFLKGMEIENSFVVFNSDPDWVSDHSGLLTRIRLR